MTLKLTVESFNEFSYDSTLSCEQAIRLRLKLVNGRKKKKKI